MSIAMYLELNTWNWGLVCIDIFLFVLGIVIRHVFPTKNQLIIICSSSLVILFSSIGGIFLSSVVPTRLIYILGSIAFSMFFFVTGVVVTMQLIIPILIAVSKDVHIGRPKKRDVNL